MGLDDQSLLKGVWCVDIRTQVLCRVVPNIKAWKQRMPDNLKLERPVLERENCKRRAGAKKNN